MMWTAYAFIKEVIEEFNRDNCMRMAAAIAYYTIFSLAPLTTVVLMMTSLLYDPANVHSELEDQLSLLLTEQGAQQIQAMAANTDQHPAGFWGSVVGLTMLVYGAIRGISEVQSALNTVWKVPRKKDAKQMDAEFAQRGFFIKRLISFGMMLVIALLLLASIVFSTVVAAVGDRLHLLMPKLVSQAMLMALQGGSAFIFMAVLFACLYKLLPSRPIRWRDVLSGAILAALLFMLGKFGLEFYLAKRDLSTVYGAAGSFVGVLLWINYAAVLFLFCAEWTHVWTRRFSGQETEADTKPGEGIA